MPSNSKQFKNSSVKLNELSQNELPASENLQNMSAQCDTNSKVFKYSIDINFPFTPFFISPSFQYFGYSLEAWRNESNLWIQTIHKDDKSKFIAEMENTIQGKKDFTCEYRILKQDGSICWVRNKGILVFGENNTPVSLEGNITDISAQKRIDKELNRHKNLTRTISQNIPHTTILIFDRDLRYTFAEGELLQKFQISSENIEGKTVFEVFSDETADLLANYYQLVLTGESINLEREFKEKFLVDRILPLKDENDEIYGGISIWQDITDSRFKSEKLQESEQKYRKLYETANDLIYVHDLKGNFLDMNRATEEVFGYNREEILSLNLKDVVAPKDLEFAIEMTKKKLCGDQKNTVYELNCLTKNQQKIVLEINSSLIYQNGEPFFVQGIARDITERKQMLLALRENEERLKNLFDNANDLIYIFDLKGNCLSFNSAFEKVFGYSQEEMSQIHYTKLIAQESLELAHEAFKKRINGEKGEPSEFICLTKDGRQIVIELNSSPIYQNGEIIAIQGIGRDITRRKMAEKQLADSESKLKALFLAMNDLVLVFDKDGRYLKAPQTNNPSLLYKPVEELLGKTLHEVFPKTEADFFHSKIHEALANKTSINIEYPLNVDDKTMWFSSIISPISDDTVMLVARDVTEHKIALDALKESEEQYRELFENANDLIYTLDLKGNFTSLNKAGERVSGYKRKEALKMNIWDVVAPEYIEMIKKKTKIQQLTKKPMTYDSEIIAKNGNRLSLEISTRLIYQGGKLVGIQGIGRDITERKKDQEALRSSERKYRLLSEGIVQQVWTAGADGLLDYVNGRTLEYFGKPSNELLGVNWVKYIHPDDLEITNQKWSNSLKTGEFLETAFRLRQYDGEYRWFRVMGVCEKDATGKIVKWYGTNTDIHDQKMAEEQLSHFARHDVLTGLPNRFKFMNYLERVSKIAKNNSKHCFAIFFLDIDRFKLINDSFGHLVGDKLLVAFAERLQKNVRLGDVVARLGGDEFTILLNNLNNPNEAIILAERLIQSFLEPFNIKGYEVFTSASIGIVISDETAREPIDYLRDADTAMYRAKEAGKSCYEIFNPQMHAHNLNLLHTENDLRRAIERNEFQVFYQPIVSLETGEVHAFEALVRWRHPERGLVFPLDFIPIAEETGLIVPIGKWVLEESCRQAVEWQKRFPKHKPFLISVNLSSKQLLHPTLISHVQEVLAKTKLNPKYLELEVTESIVMENERLAFGILDQLKDMGISLSTDDFGTGYSSLSYLHQFPFDTLKIDRSFVGKMDSNHKSAEIVSTILTLAQNLSLKVVAEGIETEEQLRQLQLLGCNFGQGYLFAKAVVPSEAECFLSDKSENFRFSVPPIFKHGNIPMIEMEQ